MFGDGGVSVLNRWQDEICISFQSRLIIFIILLLGPNPAINGCMAAMALFFLGGDRRGPQFAPPKSTKRDKKVVSNDAAVKYFLDDPLRCIVDGGGNSPYAVDSCRDIFVRSMSVTTAFVENVAIHKKERIATLGHIAVGEGLECRKIGRRLALALRSELVWHLGETGSSCGTQRRIRIRVLPSVFQQPRRGAAGSCQTRPGRATGP